MPESGTGHDTARVSRGDATHLLRSVLAWGGVKEIVGADVYDRAWIALEALDSYASAPADLPVAAPATTLRGAFDSDASAPNGGGEGDADALSPLLPTAASPYIAASPEEARMIAAPCNACGASTGVPCASDCANKHLPVAAPAQYAWTFDCGHTTIGPNSDPPDACPACGDTSLRRKSPSLPVAAPGSASVSPADTIRRAIGNPKYAENADALAALGVLLAALRVAEERNERLTAAIEDYILWEPGREGHAEAHRRLRAVLADEEEPERQVAEGYLAGMRESQPKACWRLLDEGRWCCILYRGHDDGIHEPWAGSPEGKP